MILKPFLVARPVCVILLALAGPFLSAASAQGVGQLVRYARVFNGITAPAVSSPITNNGQGLHILACFAPTAGATVTGELVRLEASFDNSVFFPISLDITTLPYIGSPARAFSIIRANGSFPYVRVAAITVNAGFPLTCHYTGGVFPIGNVFLAGDRYISVSPTGGQDKFTFLGCLGSSCSVENNVTSRYVVTQDSRLEKCYITAKTAPQGSATTVQIVINGVTNVFTSGFSLSAGQTGVDTIRSFAVGSLIEGDILTMNITAVGSSNPGADLTVVCKVTF